MKVTLREGEGVLLGYQKNVVELLSPAPYAPGAPATFQVEDLSLEGRSLGSKRQPDGRFVVRFRLITLRREDRARLEAIAAAKAATSSP